MPSGSARSTGAIVEAPPVVAPKARKYSKALQAVSDQTSCESKPQPVPRAEAPGPLFEGARAAEPLSPLTLSGRRVAASASSPSPAALQSSAEEATR